MMQKKAGNDHQYREYKFVTYRKIDHGKPKSGEDHFDFAKGVVPFLPCPQKFISHTCISLIENSVEVP
jgi:hypothetical protein